MAGDATDLIVCPGNSLRERLRQARLHILRYRHTDRMDVTVIGQRRVAGIAQAIHIGIAQLKVGARRRAAVTGLAGIAPPVRVGHLRERQLAIGHQLWDALGLV